MIGGGRGAFIGAVHRMALLHGRLSVRCPAFQLQEAHHHQGCDQPQPELPEQPAPAQGRGGEMHLLPAPHSVKFSFAMDK